MYQFANVIIDISHEKVDKTFQYKIPESLRGTLHPGMEVLVPFGKGNTKRKAYIMSLSNRPEFDTDKMKYVLDIAPKGIAVEDRMVELAAWIRENYGGTMFQALKTVLPVKQKIREKSTQNIILKIEKEKAQELLEEWERKHYRAKVRLLTALLENECLEKSVITGKLNVATSTIQSLGKDGILAVEETRLYRNPVKEKENTAYHLTLNEEQEAAVQRILNRNKEKESTFLLEGVTGSGKTEVYMELIAKTLEEGKEAICLIPEIALTYQTVLRFTKRFGNQVSIMNSKLSMGEKFDQFERAKNGEIKIMIGPRSALFTPFKNLGIIIIDEEHEASYKSETVPCYHAREVAIERAKKESAYVVLGSATPSVESYYKAQQGQYVLCRLTKRVSDRPLPDVEVVDLREELKEGNRSILSRSLVAKMENCLNKKEQMMLFINRRGYAGFVSCRTCGTVMKCPHCDVSLYEHKGVPGNPTKRLVCHYCGFEQEAVSNCPSCGSKYIGGFRAGTQQMEEVVRKQFPQARILRMDFDTTREKDAHEKILESFANGEADILIGTQMIVKGHNFPKVTLMGVVAADLSLHTNDYRAAERTFQILTQAAGRAGRGDLPGEVVIQTYQPEHYSIQAAIAQNYEAFYQEEILYRKLTGYPPLEHMVAVYMFSPEQQALETMAKSLKAYLDGYTKSQEEHLKMIGPADCTVAKVNDVYRKVLYLLCADYAQILKAKEKIEFYMDENVHRKDIIIQYNNNPM